MPSISLEVDAPGLEPLILRLEAAPAILRERLAQAMRLATLATEGEVKSRTPRVTGRLQSSIHSETREEAGGVVGSVSTNVFYAPFVEEGRGPVFARPGHYLRFRPKGARAFIFRKSVGPAAGRHMFRDSAQMAMRALQQQVLGAAQATADAIAG